MTNKCTMCGHITISLEELQRLQQRDAELSALEVGGVDNWEWYGESLKHLRKDDDEGDDDLEADK